MCRRLLRDRCLRALARADREGGRHFEPEGERQAGYPPGSVQGEIERLPSDTVVSTRLNQYFRKQVFLEVLVHIRGVIEGPAAKLPAKEK